MVWRTSNSNRQLGRIYFTSAKNGESLNLKPVWLRASGERNGESIPHGPHMLPNSTFSIYTS